MRGRVRRFVQQHGLLTGRVAACVSGGADSMALLHLLVELGHRPHVVTFDHGLRQASAAECAMVAAESGRLGLTCDVVALGVAPGPGVAARARQARRDALPEADSVALGHHADDQAETVLDRLLRGSGARGLAAMQPRSGRVVRPLLCVTRAEVLRFCAERGVSYVDDPSNASGTRGRLRHQALPLLESIREGATGGLARSALHLAQDDALLDALADEWLSGEGVDTRGPVPLVRRALLKLVRAERGHGEIHSRALDAAQALVEGAGVDVGAGWRLVRHRGRVRCVHSPTSGRDDVDPVST